MGEKEDFIDAYLSKIDETKDPSSSFFGNRGLQSLDCVLIDLFIGITLVLKNAKVTYIYYFVFCDIILSILLCHKYYLFCSDETSQPQCSAVHIFRLSAHTSTGGSETTAMMLNWTVLYFLHYPDVQKKVQKSID